jgi:phosphate transport system substrate-binding protein
MKKLIALYCIILFSNWLNGCKDVGKIEYYPSIEEKNTGELILYCDENLRSIIQQQKEVFEHHFPAAKIEMVWMPEALIIEKLLNGTARTAIISRKLSKNEITQISKTDTIRCKEHYVAKSALVLVCSKSEARKFSLDELKSLFGGNQYKIIIEGKQSDRLPAITNTLHIHAFGKNIYAVNSADSVLAYVNRDKNSIGIIDYAHISDEFSLKSEKIHQSVSLVGVVVNCHDSLQTVSANPSDIFTGCYPLIIPVNYIVTDYKNKLSLGFVNFMVKQKGARIFLRSGYIPAVMPQREIVVDTTGFSFAQ